MKMRKLNLKKTQTMLMGINPVAVRQFCQSQIKRMTKKMIMGQTQWNMTNESVANR